MLALAFFSLASFLGLAHQHTENGLRYLEVFDFDRAFGEFRTALELAPDSEIAKVNLGIAHYYLGQFTEARSRFEQVLESSPEDARALFLMGILEKQADEPDRASSLFRKVLSIDQNDFAAYYQLGLLAFEGENYSDAVKAFESASRLNPDCTAALYNLARALMRSGQTARGQELLNEFQSLTRKRENHEVGGMGQPTVLQGKYAQVLALPE